MKDVFPLVALLFVALSIGCTKSERKTGKVIRIDYRNVDIEKGEWVKIDSFKFAHIGRREEAKNKKYPLPSSEVLVDSVRGKEFSRDYNSTGIPVYISKYLNSVNKKIPKEKRFLVENRFILLYSGILKIRKRDSSSIKVSSSKEYAPKIEVVDRNIN